MSGKGFLGNMTENLQADCVQSRQAGFMQCFLGLAEQIVDIPHLFRKYSFIIHQDCEDYKAFVKILHFATKKPVRRGLCR